VNLFLDAPRVPLMQVIDAYWPQTYRQMVDALVIANDRFGWRVQPVSATRPFIQAGV
jgi:hypothetical protein